MLQHSSSLRRQLQQRGKLWSLTQRSSLGSARKVGVAGAHARRVGVAGGGEEVRAEGMRVEEMRIKTSTPRSWRQLR